jgi:hypothetical protein
MKQNLILVVILLASILMVNAIPHQFNKRATSFTTCSKEAPNTITVTVQPDPPVPGQDCTFSVGGTFAIDAGYKMLVVPVDSTTNSLGEPLLADICTTGGITCPTDPTTPFNIVQSFTLPAQIPALTVSIGDATGNILACSIANISS